MKLTSVSFNRIITIAILAAAILYAAFYFNYFETPSGDYIGNITEPVHDYMKGNFPGANYKFLPLYPLLLSFFTRFNPDSTGDPIYLTAIIVNFFLFIPYIITAYFMYRRFLSEKITWAAMIFLSINMYTLYSVVNAELEILLSLLIIISLYLALSDSKISYLTAFLTAVTKWDSVFIIPAVMFRDFFYNKKKVRAVALGAAATSGVAAWVLLSFINSRGHTYISEIAHRGPNIYRFIVDCFLVTSGFVQWMATHAWFSENVWVTISLLAFIVIPALATITGVVWGIALVIKERRKEFAPIFIFFGGFLLIHMIYQNTKDRYVLPILWIMILFLFYGLSNGLWPWMSHRFNDAPEKKQAALASVMVTVSGILYLVTMGAIVLENTPPHVLFALLFTGLMSVVILFGNDKKYRSTTWILVLVCGIIINVMVFYGVRLMDHHGISRVEFKKVALWYKDHALPGDRMLISETNVPKYFSQFDDSKYIISFSIKGNTIEELVPELKDKKATYVFVDDFYIRRLKYKDPNAIDRKAWIFKEIRDKGEKTGHFKLVKIFQAKDSITSYLYKFIP